MDEIILLLSGRLPKPKLETSVLSIRIHVSNEPGAGNREAAKVAVWVTKFVSNGAYVNLGAYYLVGLPIGAVLAFVFHLKGTGLWTALIIGSTVQVVLLALKTIFTNWQKQASKVRERIFEADS
ncbi:hypothetical protein FEM48_Zijuj12G0164900 [Ziziphus jujuba var. spinosa]|uniref:Uncharacterized protein n=1 Tax=Ziziphus jujuba var. spinosa TaxID=714518 RepID=A0A978UEE7_ZIZJJ|nr:hypothetical protein FEM48_Zijuj12G0164900 [Ziziphus jujuba var. spinosa]